MDTKTKAIEKNYKIIFGPGKDALFNACKHAFGKVPRPKIEFTIVVEHPIPPYELGGSYIPMRFTETRVYGVCNDGQSGEDFIVWGTLKEKNNNMLRFRAHYNTRKKNGEITVFTK